MKLQYAFKDTAHLDDTDDEVPDLSVPECPLQFLDDMQGNVTGVEDTYLDISAHNVVRLRHHHNALPLAPTRRFIVGQRFIVALWPDAATTQPYYPFDDDLPDLVDTDDDLPDLVDTDDDGDILDEMSEQARRSP